MRLQLIALFVVCIPFTTGAVEPKRISEDLFAGVAIAPSDFKVFFGMEKLDYTNIYEWQEYTDSAARLASPNSILSFLLKHTNAKQFPRYSQQIGLETGLSALEYDGFMRSVQAAKLYESAKMKTFQGLSSGAAIEYRVGDWLIYASKRPVTAKFKFPQIPRFWGQGHEERPGTLYKLKHFVQDFRDVLMTVKLDEYGRKPYTHQRGIFKNPAQFATPDDSYAGISTLLTGFGASVAFRFFRDRSYEKRYLVINPLPAMAKILRKEVKPGQLFIGTNLDKTHYDLFPPIVYVRDNKVQIAVRGTNLADYPNGLPERLIVYDGDKTHDNILLGGASDDEGPYIIVINAIARAYEQ